MDLKVVEFPEILRSFAIAMQNTLRRLSFCTALLALCYGGAAPSEGNWTESWAHERSRLAPAKDVLWGRLPNGLRYALLPHGGIPHRVSMKLLVLVGSIEEEEDELGIAHFTEHMAFNGTRHFEAGELLSFFQQVGMEYGSDINASTTFDYTAYDLELWENEESVIRKSLLLLRDIADGVLFEETEIDKERKVIMSEMRGRDGLEYRTVVAFYKLVYDGLKAAERIPIGTPETINSLRREQFLRFYKKWYRPDLMYIVATGDFDPAQLERLIAEYCGDIQRPSTPLPTRDLGKLRGARALRASSLRISDVGSAQIRAASIRPTKRRSDSWEGRKESLNREFAQALFQQRLQHTGSDFSGGTAEYTSFLGIETATAVVVTSGQQWRDAVRGLDRAIRFTLKEGFSQRDISRFRDRELANLRTMRTVYPKLDPSLFTQLIADSILNDRVYVGYDRHLALADELLRAINPKILLRSFRECWDLEKMAFFVAGEVDIENAARAITRVVTTGRRDRAELYIQDYDTVPEFEAPMLFREGRVVEERELPEFSAHLIRFDNNVHLNFLSTQNEPGLVSVLVRVGGGLFDLEDNRPGLREFALQAFIGSGTKRYQPDAIRSMLEKRMLVFSFDVLDHDAFSFRATCSTDDLDLFLGIITDYLNDPEIYRFSYRNALVGAAMQRFQSAVGLQDGFRAFENFLFRDDGRFVWGTLSDYKAIGVMDVRRWLVEPLGSGYLELSIVGDISRERAVESVRRTLGALADRRLTKKNALPKRPVEVKAPTGYRRLEFVGEEHLAIVLGYWAIEGALDLRDEIALVVLTRVIERRLWESLREDLGVTYSPKATFSSEPEYPEFANVQATVDCSPQEAPDIARAMLKISQEIADQGVTVDDIADATVPISVKLRQALLSNEFLLDSVLKRAQEQPESIDQIVALKNGIVSTITVDEVNAFAKQVMGPENARAAAIIPKPFVGIFQTEEQ